MAKHTNRQSRVDGDLAYIPLTQGYEAIIDAADVPLVSGVNWMAHVTRYRDGTIRCVYAYRNTPTIQRTNGKNPPIYLHRVLTEAPVSDTVDHRDGNGLNNRRNGDQCNLRLATREQNSQNRRVSRTKTSSGVKGVCWHDQEKKWWARIRSKGKSHSLGLFGTIEDAAKAYARASASLHGEFGCTTA